VLSVSCSQIKGNDARGGGKPKFKETGVRVKARGKWRLKLQRNLGTMFTKDGRDTKNVRHRVLLLLLLFFNYALHPLRLIVRSGLDVPTFDTRRLHACHHATAPGDGWWNCGREMFGNFALISE